MIHTITDHHNRVFRLSDESDENDSPFKATTAEISELLDKGYRAIQKKEKGIEKKLEGWIQKYPDYPQFKNYLSVYYSLTNRKEKAFTYNQEMEAMHPAYIYSRINRAEECLAKGEMANVPDILGSTFDLAALYPDRKIFHVTEFASYYKVVIRYWFTLNEVNKARPVVLMLEELEKIFGRSFGVKDFSQLLMLAGLKKAAERLMRDKTLTSAVRQKPTRLQTTQPPVFHYPQIRWLYEQGFHIEKEKINELLSLERNRLVNDLSAVLYDAIQRYDVFYDIDFEFNTHSFPLHALFLLQELRAGEALPAVLEFLRQPKELLEFWLADGFIDYGWQVVFATGREQLPVLEAFLKEPLNPRDARTEVSRSLCQVALHEPHRRKEIIGLYGRLLDFFYAQKENKNVFDVTVVSFIIGNVIDLGGVELTATIKRLYDENLADTSLHGDWEEVKELLESWEDTDEAKMELETLDELMEQQRYLEDREEEEDEQWDMTDVGEAEENKSIFYSGHTPYRKPEQTVGRNTPCPCGSGLKYKRCHGKTE